MMQAPCLRFREDVLGVLEGNAEPSLLEHVAGCDDCRDARHALDQNAIELAKAGDDFAVSDALTARLAALAEAEGERISETRMRGAEPASAPRTSSKPRVSKKAIWLLLAAAASVGASVFVGVKIADRQQKSPEAAATRAWHGKLAKIVTNGTSKTSGIWTETALGKSQVAEGAEIKPGMRVWTDKTTRARLELDDGSVVVLDRATSVRIESNPRTLLLQDGVILADVAHVDGAPWARVRTKSGDVKVLGTKLTVTAQDDRTNVEVLRGEVEVEGPDGKGRTVAAGQEGVVGKDGRVDVTPVNDLAQRAAFGGELLWTHNEDADPPASGVGELRARRPGKTDEKDHAVRLTKHAVKIRIAGNVARTEIDEEFANETSDDLEGIFRFPLPPGAQIERLALEVDGKLVDGEFIDKAKGAAIWRGAIQSATPKAPKPREEIFWVPGPWRDPALLEWSRGGRFELKIFPIPKKGARRVTIAYTEAVAPVSGMRRYVYPLAQGTSSNLTIDNFSVDAQVIGHDPKSPVRVRGYELDHKTEAGSEKFVSTTTAFAPSGDLAIEYALDDRATDASVWTYAAPAGVTSTKGKTEDPVGTDAFVAIALRPKLPKWTEQRPRDQVVVVDVGRAAFGERYLRSRRLAVQIAQEMDRRDRLAVLACDVTCRAMPGGFVGPGAPSAHDVDAFLAGIVPDGASDLVGAVRAAGSVSGHDKARDLRVVLLSDGVATAGYRSGARVASEVSDALGDARAEVVTVPIGADADTKLLGEIARGSGGVVVPYQPGQRLEATALEVLNATYGRTLRDVELVLPEGLYAAAPSTLAPMRAGGETIVGARMRGDAVKGEITLRGKVGSETFEAKYPIDVKAETNQANAFVPRLFAAARISDRERTATEKERTELVALSQRFAVPSRFTSLLVLESEAMFRAFGIDRTSHAPAWTGEAAGRGFDVATAEGSDEKGKLSSSPYESDDSVGDTLSSIAKSTSPAKKDSEDKSFGLGGLGSGGGGRSAAGPAPTTAPPADAPRPAARRPAALGAPDEEARREAPDVRAWDDRRRGGQWMKRIFVRRGSISADGTTAATSEKIAQARTAVTGAPDDRSKHRDLAKLLAAAGRLDELGEALDRWSTRDPLDAEVIMSRADLAARRGDRDGALRIMSGSLAATALSDKDAFTYANVVARDYERLGLREGCAFFVTAAELRPTDNEAIARAMTCERAAGHAPSAERWLTNADPAKRTAIASALAKVAAEKTETATGDIVVAASWEGGGDLDLAIVDPAGRRAAAVTRMRGVRVEGAQARDHETVALSSGDAGTFLVEVARATSGESLPPMSGKVTIRAFGQSQTIPFTLTGARTVVGRVDARWEAELVPVESGGIGTLPPFDRGAATRSLASISVAHCAAGGMFGSGHVTVTFSQEGRPSSSVVDDGLFAGSGSGRCVQAAFFGARVAPFAGAQVSVGRSFTISPQPMRPRD